MLLHLLLLLLLLTLTLPSCQAAVHTHRLSTSSTTTVNFPPSPSTCDNATALLETRQVVRTPNSASISRSRARLQFTASSEPLWLEFLSPDCGTLNVSATLPFSIYAGFSCSSIRPVVRASNESLVVRGSIVYRLHLASTPASVNLSFAHHDPPCYSDVLVLDSTRYYDTVLVDDFVGDGSLSFLAVDSSLGATQLFAVTQTSPGVFKQQFPTWSNEEGESPIDFAHGDVNGDGRADVLMTAWEQRSFVTLFANRGPFPENVEVLQVPVAEAHALELHDLDADGDLDLLCGLGTGLAVLINADGLGSFEMESIVPLGDVVNAIRVTDFTGNGHPDLLVSMDDDRDIDSPLVLRAIDEWRSAWTVSGPLHTRFGRDDFIETADINSDGAADVVAMQPAGYRQSRLAWNENRGGTGDNFASSNVLRTFSWWSSPFAVGDFLGNGAADILVADAQSNSALLFYNLDGKGGFPATPHVVPNVTSGVGMAVFDLQGDGQPDFLVHNLHGRRGVTVYAGNMPPLHEPFFNASRIRTIEIRATGALFYVPTQANFLWSVAPATSVDPADCLWTPPTVSARTGYVEPSGLTPLQSYCMILSLGTTMVFTTAAASESPHFSAVSLLCDNATVPFRLHVAQRNYTVTLPSSASSCTITADWPSGGGATMLQPGPASPLASGVPSLAFPAFGTEQVVLALDGGTVYSFRLTRAHVAVPTEVFFNPTREDNPEKVNRWPLSALKFVKLRRRLVPLSPTTSVRLGGSVSASLGDVLRTASPGSDLFVVKNEAAFRATFVPPFESVVMQWERGGDLSVADHDDDAGVVLFVDDVPQWAVRFDSDQPWAAAANGQGRSIVDEFGSFRWETGPLLSSLTRVAADESVLTKVSPGVMAHESQSAFCVAQLPLVCGFHPRWDEDHARGMVAGIPLTRSAVADGAGHGRQAAIGFINDDVLPDVVAVLHDDDTSLSVLVWFQSLANGTVLPRRAIGFLEDFDGGLDTAELSSDGVSDVVVMDDGELHLFENDGFGVHWTRHKVSEVTLGLEDFVLFLGNLTGYGPRFVSQIRSSGQMMHFSLGAPDEYEVIGYAGSLGNCRVADRDGSQGIVCIDDRADFFRWFYGNGTSSNGTAVFDRYDFYAADGSDGVTAFALGDADLDGAVDVFLLLDGKIGWLRNDGQGGFESPGSMYQIDTTPSKYWSYAALWAGDVGSGATDLLVLGQRRTLHQQDSDESGLFLFSNTNRLGTSWRLTRLGEEIGGDAAYWGRWGAFVAGPLFGREPVAVVLGNQPSVVLFDMYMREASKPMFAPVQGRFVSDTQRHWVFSGFPNATVFDEAGAAIPIHGMNWSDSRAVAPLILSLTGADVHGLATLSADSSELRVFANSGQGDGVFDRVHNVPLSHLRLMVPLPSGRGLLVVSEAEPMLLQVLPSNGTALGDPAVLLNVTEDIHAMAQPSNTTHDFVLSSGTGTMVWVSLHTSEDTATELFRLDALSGVNVDGVSDGGIRLMRMGDFDGDRVDDMAFVWDDAVYILPGVAPEKGSVGFASTLISKQAKSPLALSVMDANMDGLLDVSTDTAVYLSPTTSFSPVVLRQDSVYDIVIGVVSTASSVQGLRVLAYDNGKLLWLPGEVPVPVSELQIRASGVDLGVLHDVDGDGMLDVFLLGDGFAWLRNNNTGSGQFDPVDAPMPLLNGEPASPDVTSALCGADLDFDLDGVGDCVSTGEHGWLALHFPRPGPRIETRIVFSNQSSGSQDWTIAGVADVTQDGHLDVLVLDVRRPGRLYTFVNNGTGHFPHFDVVTLVLNDARLDDSSNHRFLVSKHSDFNDDGHPDLLVGSVDEHVVLWLEGPDFVLRHQLLEVEDPRALVLCNVGGGARGLVDIGVGFTGGFVYLERRGPGDFVRRNTVPTLFPVHAVLAVDADNDTDSDFVLTGDGAEVLLLENRNTAEPDESSSISCSPALLEIAPGVEGSAECFILPRQNGVPVVTSSTMFFLSLESDGDASTSPPQPQVASSFRFEVVSSRAQAVSVSTPLTGSASVRFVYPPPEILPRSLELVEGVATWSFGQIVMQSSSAAVIALNVTSVGDDASIVSITYGPLSDTQLFRCTVQRVVPLTSAVGRVECLTEGQEQLDTLVPLFFRASVLSRGSPEDQTNSLELAPAPQVTSVTGCDEDDTETGATRGCPLEGGILLTVQGVRLGINGTTNLLIGSRLCQTVGRVYPTNLTCLLPASDGGSQLVAPFTIPRADLAVDNDRSAIFGPPRSLLSYRRPAIVALSGCSPTLSDTLHLVDCARLGGTLITVTGMNLGSVDAGVVVSIGGAACRELEAVESAATSNTTSVRCELPPGVQRNLQVLVLDVTGRPSDTRALLSYEQCPRGTFVNRTTCVTCPLGSATSEAGETACTACVPGRFANESGSSQCSDCVAGRFSAVLGGTTCRPCTPGTFQAQPQRSSCDACELGRFARGNASRECDLCSGLGVATGRQASACTDCPPGSAPASTRDRCTVCAAGRFSNASTGQCQACAQGFIAPPSAFACEQCEAGRFQAADQATCRDCEPGRYAHRNGSIACVLCEAGSVASGRGASACVQCAPGFFQSDSVTCSLCDAGRYTSQPGSLACSACDRNTVARSAGLTGCEACPLVQFTAPGDLGRGRSTCDRCSGGEYVQYVDGNTSMSRAKRDCLPCPAGAECAGTSGVRARDGQWVVRREDGVVESFVCLPGRCEECAEDDEEASARFAVSCCTRNRAPAEENPMCGRCAAGFVDWGGSCIECDKADVGLLAGMVLTMWVVVMVLHKLNQQSNPLTLVFFYYVQMALLLFGEETEWMAWTSFFNFNPMQNAAGGRCVAPWSPVTKMLVGALTPLLTWLLLGATAVLQLGVSTARDGALPDWPTFLAPYWRSCIAFFLFCYNNLANTSLRFFECLDVAGGRWRVVRSSPDIDCRSEEYKRVVPLFALCLALVVASPLLVVYWLRRPHIRALVDKARVDGKNSDSRLLHVWGILFVPFKGTTHSLPYYWNAIVLLRRVMVVSVSVVALAAGHTARYAAVTVAHILVLAVHMYWTPFRDMTSDGVYVRDAAHRQRLVHANRRVLPVNQIESVSLTLLAAVSATLAAVELPLKDTQALVYSIVVFSWLAVLGALIAWRALAKQARRRATRAALTGVSGRASSQVSATREQAQEDEPAASVVRSRTGTMVLLQFGEDDDAQGEDELGGVEMGTY